MSNNANVNPDPQQGAVIRRPFRLVVVFALAFFILSAAALPLISRWRGDERYYTDASIRMVQTGDYLTPYFGNGNIRFNKPALNYWLIAASFKLLGISVFSARVVQLAASTLALLAVYRLAMVLFQDRDVALLATGIMLTNMEMLNASMCSTTDPVQYLLLTVALVGFTGMLFHRDGSAWHDRLCAYGGLGLAALTKGGMALVVLLFTILFAVWRNRRPKGVGIARPTAVVTWYWVAPAFLPLAVWMGLNVHVHGMRAALKFWNDQIGNRLDGSGGSLATNLLTYGATPITAFFPWTVLLVVAGWGKWQRIRELAASRRNELLFACGWFIVVFAIFICGNITRLRYFLPTFPMLSAAIAYFLVQLCRDRPSADKIIGALARAGVLIVLGYGLLLTALGARIAYTATFGGVGLAISAAVAWAWLRQRRPGVMDWLAVALLAMAAYRVTDLSIRSRLFITAVDETVRQVLTTTQGSSPSLAVVGMNDEAAQIRLASAGRIQVSNIPQATSNAALDQYSAIFTFANARLDPGQGYHRVDVGLSCNRWRPQDFARLLLGLDTLDHIYQTRGLSYHLFLRNPEHPIELQ